MKLRVAIIIFLLSVPATSFAANKEMEALQRDVALMQEDIRQLQRAFEEQTAILKTLAQQAVDNTTRISGSLAVVESNVPAEIKQEMGSALAPVAGLNTRLDQVSSQVQTLSDAVQALNASMQQLHGQLADLKNVVSAIQVAPQPPQSTDPANPNGTGAPASTAPPIPLNVLYQNGVRDMGGNNLDLALSEFANCVKWYHDDPLAASCQFYVGIIHYSRQEFDQAVKEFDAVLEQFPKGERTADAHYYKGLSLAKLGQRQEAKQEFLAVIQQFPDTAAADRAREQMKAPGF